MDIRYQIEPDLTPEEFRQVLIASTLGERRPVQDLERLDRMLRNAGLIVTARQGDKLVGISRAILDGAWCCYLSDLAVDQAFQHRGIGKRLIAETKRSAGPEVALILIAAPAAEAYYPKIGMEAVKSAWVIQRER